MLKNMSVRTFISCFLLCVFLMDTVLIFLLSQGRMLFISVAGINFLLYFYSGAT
jgi:hypothetical protein